jgi:uncharacterized repeat protein (TIGR01451 family)
MEPRTLLATTFTPGDLLIGTKGGTVEWRTAAGTLVKTLPTDLNSSHDGMAFDGAGNLFVTNFDDNTISKIDPTGSFSSQFAGGINANPQSIAFDAAGNLFVGVAGGDHQVREYGPKGTLINTFPVALENGGSNWVELSPDQHTLYYTSEGKSVLTYNTATKTQGAAFATNLPGTAAQALRLLPDGGMLVADTQSVVRLDKTGAVVKTYTVPGANDLFAVNIDPTGAAFWTADGGTTNVYEIDIASGVVIGHINSNPGTAITGLAVKGEIIMATSADLAIISTSAPTTGTLGSTLTFQYQVTNNGPNSDTNVVVTDVLPAGLTFVSSTPQGNTQNGVLTIPLGTLAKGASATVTIVVGISGSGPFQHTVSVSGSMPDPVLTNNSVTTTISTQVAPPVTNTDGPRVVSVQRVGLHRQPTRVIVTFNEPLNATTAQYIFNYNFIAQKADPRAGVFRGTVIPVRSAVYDPAANTVTLTPFLPLNIRLPYTLIITGSIAGGVSDVNGLLLDGAGTGVPGSNFVTTVVGGTSGTTTPVVRRHVPTPRHHVSTHAAVQVHGRGGR